jgi:transposase
MNSLTPSIKLLTPEVLENTPEPVLVVLAEFSEALKVLQERVEHLEARLNQNSGNSNKPSSTDNPFQKSASQPKKQTKRRNHKGSRQQCLRPTEVVELLPDACKCGCHEITDAEPYYIHQVIEFPEIKLDVRHIILYRGRCARCASMNKALIPCEQRSGYGPRLSAMIAEMVGTQADSRRTVQNFCASVLDLPISLGGIQKILDRVSTAIEPHYEAIGDIAHNAPVNHVDETSWRRNGKLTWLWVMGNAFVAFFKVHDERSKKAFEELKGDWNGILVSDDYGLYRKWVGQRQSCLAHLIRRAKGLSERKDARVAGCGKWAYKELRRLCHMSNEPPSVGEWNMFYARFIRLTSKYGTDKNEAGAFARRLRQEMADLWLFLEVEGVEPTNNHAERLLRFAVTWRKSSFGSASEKGERWTERILSLRHTCRLKAKRTYPVLVNAMRAYFHGQQPDLSWIQAEM